MANRIAEITLPDGRVAEIEGDEAKIMDFINSLPDTTQPAQEVAQQQAKSKPSIMDKAMSIGRGVESGISNFAKWQVEQANKNAAGLMLINPERARQNVQKFYGKDPGPMPEPSFAGKVVGSALLGRGASAVAGAAIPAVARYAPMVKEAVGGAVSSLGYTQAERDFDSFKDAGKTAVVGAIAAPLTTAGIRVVGKISEKLASPIYNQSVNFLSSFLKPKEKYLQFGADPAGQIVKEKIVAKSFKDLTTKLDSKLAEATTDLDKLYTQNKGYLNLSSLIDDTQKYIDDLANTSYGDAQKATVKNMQSVIDDIKFKHKGLTSISRQEAWELKKRLAKDVKWTPTADSAKLSENEVKQTFIAKLSDSLEANTPKLKEANQRWRNLLTAKKSVESAEERLGKQSVGGLMSKLALGAGAMTGSGKALALGATLAGLRTVPGRTAAVTATASAAEAAAKYGKMLQKARF